jgi:dTDP-4-dehydrorhamnose 3,5-epimerase
LYIEPLAIREVLLLTPIRHGDARGFFSEVYRADVPGEHGQIGPFVQDNHVYSKDRGVLRGLHFQVGQSAQGKLVRCTRGAIWDVAVDVRRSSPTFGQNVAHEISAENWKQIWVPPGFAHGYITLEPETEVLYKVTSYYDPSADRGVAWDDPALGIDWPLDRSEIILSPKDEHHPRLADISPVFE